MGRDTVEMGQFFREKRSESELTLRDVENSTSIRMSYLEAIENGAEDQFFSKVYMIGFIRQYAQFLGVDVKLLQERYPSVFETHIQNQDFAYGIGTLERRAGEKGSHKRSTTLLWIGVLAVSVFLAWKLVKYLNLF